MATTIPGVGLITGFFQGRNQQTEVATGNVTSSNEAYGINRDGEVFFEVWDDDFSGMGDYKVAPKTNGKKGFDILGGYDGTEKVGTGFCEALKPKPNGYTKQCKLTHSDEGKVYSRETWTYEGRGDQETLTIEHEVYMKGDGKVSHYGQAVMTREADLESHVGNF